MQIFSRFVKAGLEFLKADDEKKVEEFLGMSESNRPYLVCDISELSKRNYECSSLVKIAREITAPKSLENTPTSR